MVDEFVEVELVAGQEVQRRDRRQERVVESWAERLGRGREGEREEGETQQRPEGSWCDTRHHHRHRYLGEHEEVERPGDIFSLAGWMFGESAQAPLYRLQNAVATREGRGMSAVVPKDGTSAQRMHGPDAP